jgi:hypothetical protein
MLLPFAGQYSEKPGKDVEESNVCREKRKNINNRF